MKPKTVPPSGSLPSACPEGSVKGQTVGHLHSQVAEPEGGEKEGGMMVAELKTEKTERRVPEGSL